MPDDWRLDAEYSYLSDPRFLREFYEDEFKTETETATFPEATEIDLTDFENLYQRLINSTLKERKQMKGLESHRLETIVPASLVVKFLMGKLKLRRIIQSNFALKEGVLYEMLHS